MKAKANGIHNIIDHMEAGKLENVIEKLKEAENRYKEFNSLYDQLKYVSDSTGVNYEIVSEISDIMDYFRN